jgi:hypothetical protein
LAIVSVIALLGALGLAALIALQPWAANSVAPQLRVAPGLGVALGDSVAVSRSRQLAVASARAATGGKPRFAAGKAVGDDGASKPELAIAGARVVRSAQPVDRPESSPGTSPSEPPPVAQPAPAPAPVAVPIAAPAPSPAPEPAATSPAPVVTEGHSPGPIGAGTGPLEGSPGSAIEVHQGDGRALSFSFYVQPTAYRPPGEENLILQFKGEAGAPPSFGLQLWDDGSGTQRGLWASGDAVGGERFLAPVAEGVWHEAALCFEASSEGDGFYLLLLDGQPIDARAWVSLIASDSDSAQVEVGLFREGEPVVDASDVFFGPATFGETLESVIP